MIKNDNTDKYLESIFDIKNYANCIGEVKLRVLIKFHIIYALCEYSILGMLKYL